MLNVQSQTAPGSEFFQRDFHGAAIIDHQGHEIPMTAEMIDSALEKISHEQEQLPKKHDFITF